METNANALIQRLADDLQWYIDEDETNRGDNSENGGTNWDEENAYWIEGQDRAIQSVEQARRHLAAQPKPPTEAQLKTFACEWWRSFGFVKDKATCTWVIDEVAPEHFVDFARDVLARWGK